MFDMGGLWWLWPFGAAFVGFMFVIWAIILAFWIWMIVDAVKRVFRNDVEKVVWIIIIVLGSWLGALVYFIVIRRLNPRGLAKK